MPNSTINDALMNACLDMHAEQVRFPFSSFPMGWYAVAWLQDLALESIQRLRFCAQDLVIVRTASGKVSVYDAHCPHLGAHLGYGGVVEGENVRCPFHGWEFGEEGKCKHIPFYNSAMKVGLKEWHSHIADGMVMVWIGEQAPKWLPDSVEKSGWTLPVLHETCRWTLRSHVQEIAENGIDVAHFTTVHNAEKIGDLDALDFCWPKARWTSISSSDIGGKSSLAEAKVLLEGLGLHKVEVNIDNGKVQFRSFLYVTPLDEKNIDMRLTVSIRETGDLRKDNMLVKYLIPRLASELMKDFDIWENKKYISKPPLSRVDGPIRLFRTWASGFYNRSDA